MNTGHHPITVRRDVLVALLALLLIGWGLVALLTASYAMTRPDPVPVCWAPEDLR